MGAIKNFGFLWKRKHIKRDGTGDGGHLKGYAKGNQDKTVDFRKQIGCDVLYDKNQSIVYVGQAGNGNNNLFNRLKNHMDSNDLHNRWEYFSWVGFRDVNKGGALNAMQKSTARVSGFTYGDALNELEGILISFIEPKHNKQGAHWDGVTEYRQFINDSPHIIAEHKLDAKLDALIKEIKSISSGK
jgi:hypothetical protein